MISFIALATKQSGYCGSLHDCLQWAVERARESPTLDVLIYKARAGEKKASLVAVARGNTQTITFERAGRKAKVRNILKAVGHG